VSSVAGLDSVLAEGLATRVGACGAEEGLSCLGNAVPGLLRCFLSY
jgi:hypothetical protein